jgi:hypothetical protein
MQPPKLAFLITQSQAYSTSSPGGVTVGYYELRRRGAASRRVLRITNYQDD